MKNFNSILNLILVLLISTTMVKAQYCDAPVWEAVSVINNSDPEDVWTAITDGWSMNGFCGGGCTEQVDQWLIYGPLDMSGTSSLSLLFDAAENFGETDLNIFFTEDYSSGCPASATWTLASTVTDAGSATIDLSVATGSAVYIGIEYSDDGADGYSDWDLTNFQLSADACPAAGTPITSGCDTGSGCTDADACNFDTSATVDDGSCFRVDDPCDDSDPSTSGDRIVASCNCEGTPSDDVICFTDTACDFEIVAVALNSQSDNWTCNAGSYDANGFVGSGTAETSDLWLISGVYDFNGSSSITLQLDATEGFNGSDIEIFYTTAYSGCPGDASNNWTSAAVIASGAGGAGLTIDLSSAAGLTNVYIGIQYLSGSAPADASNWTLANISLLADACPTVGSPVTSGCDTGTGCTDEGACNYDSSATVDDGSCYSVGDACDDNNSSTTNDVYTDCDTCEGTQSGDAPCFTDTTCDFEIVAVALNSESDNWTCNAGSYDANGFVGSGTMETSDLWLISGAYDLTGSSSITLQLDATEGFNGSNIEIFYTTSYSGCPGDASNNWTSAGIIASGAGGNGLSIDLSGAAGSANVYIGIQYLSGSAPADASNWTLANISLLADACPTVGTPITSGCDTGVGCTDLNACNYDATATTDDGSCFSIGDSCDDGNAMTANDVYTDCDTCQGTAIEPGNCPDSAKINEFHYDNGGEDVNEFIEIILPAGSDPTQVQVDLYNGSGGTSYNQLILSSNEFVSTDGTFDYYVWNIDLQNGNDGITVSCIGGTLYQFITYEGSFTATDGPFAGMDGVDVGVEETSTTTETQSIMCDGSGNFSTNCTADAGSANDLATCGEAPVEGCTNPDACNYNMEATADDGSCFSIGDACDDGDPDTIGDVYTDCSTCIGETPTGQICDTPVWEAVSVVNNTQLDVWTAITDGWSMNGFCGGGCAEQVDQWLVYGPLDISSTTTLSLIFDAAENFGDTDLNIYFTTDYSSACPADATWTLAGTVADAGSANIDLSTASGAAVYIAIEYSDDGSDGYSDWDLTNFQLLADACPTVGTAIVSDCGIGVSGCTADSACNYDPTATDDDGSCLFDGDSCTDVNGNNSTFAEDCSCPPMQVDCATSAKINEFHYDNAGTDVNEFVEIALPAGSDPTSVQVDLYNGSDGTSYDSIILSAAEYVSSDATSDFYVWSPANLQNGPDGIAVSCLDGTQYQFITYEGAFDATDGAFAGITGTDTGVEEQGDAAETNSIMCDGSGNFMANCTADPGATNNLTTCVMDIPGCMDDNACNYNPDATVDDGSCQQPPVEPATACYETATLDLTTCTWVITGEQDTEPTTLCYETATFNDVTCVWEVSGTEPEQPTGLACYETATFNDVACAWEVAGTQPAQPTDLACYQSVGAFDDATCTWEILGEQPDINDNCDLTTDTFNETTCMAVNTPNCPDGTIYNAPDCLCDIECVQPPEPAIECYQTAAFDEEACQWVISGDPPLDPTGLACYETASFNNDPAVCAWEISGYPPVEPTGLACYETATFDETTCAWEVTGTQDPEPTGLACYETATFSEATCVWEVTGSMPADPVDLPCYQIATFNETTCDWEVTGEPPIEPQLECYETVTFNDVTCQWDVPAGAPPEDPITECYETATFNDDPAICDWEVIGTQPEPPTVDELECYQGVGAFDDATCTWQILGEQPNIDDGCDLTTDSFDEVNCLVVNTSTCPDGTTLDEVNCMCTEDVIPGCTNMCASNYNAMANSDDGSCILPEEPATACYETATFNTGSCAWEISGTQPDPPATECYETAEFNDASCSWVISGEQVPEPTGLACYETASFDDTSCAWDTTGEQPAQPTDLACYESVGAFDDATCAWQILGDQPNPDDGCDLTTDTFDTVNCVVVNTSTCPDNTTLDEVNCTCSEDVIPGCTDMCASNYNAMANSDDGSCILPEEPATACYETASFNETTCMWEVSGIQPDPPATECYETATFNETTCVWEVTGEIPMEPQRACYQVNVFDDVICMWVTSPGLEPMEPPTACYETATFNDYPDCSWEITGTQPEQPTEDELACYQSVGAFDDATCAWQILGEQPTIDDGCDLTVDSFDEVTCMAVNTSNCPEGTTLDQVNCECTQKLNLGCTDQCASNYDPMANSDDGSCLLPEEPVTACYEIANFNETTCAWEISGTQPEPPALECYESADFEDASCQWVVDGIQPEVPETACYETISFDNVSCIWIIEGEPPTIDDGCDLTQDSLDEATCMAVNTPDCPVGTLFDANTCACDNSSEPGFGCTDACAPNYNVNATTDDGSCESYSINCNEDCVAGPFGGTWDAASCTCIDEVEPVVGCTEPSAINYNPDVNCDDGSCEFVTVVEGCTAMDACNYNEAANTDDGSCIYATAASISTNSSTSICVNDGVDEPIDVTIDDAGQGNNGAWVITNENAMILALPDAPPFVLDDAGSGTCLIWWVNFSDDTFAPTVGDDAAALVTASSCAALSNSIAVTRTECTEDCTTPPSTGTFNCE